MRTKNVNQFEILTHIQGRHHERVSFFKEHYKLYKILYILRHNNQKQTVFVLDWYLYHCEKAKIRNYKRKIDRENRLMINISKMWLKCVTKGRERDDDECLEDKYIFFVFQPKFEFCEILEKSVSERGIEEFSEWGEEIDF